MRLPFPCVAAALCALATCPRTVGAPPCTSGWIPVGSNGEVNALVEWNGLLVAGGEFLAIGGTPANRVAVFDGQTWSALGQGLSGGTVRALTVLNGDLYAGGDFLTSGVASVPYLARWTGAQWVTHVAAPNGPVHALGSLDVFGPGAPRGVPVETLLAGGAFTHIGALSSPNLAAFQNGAWVAPINPPDGPVLVIANGTLRFGGDFFNVGAQPSRGLADFSPNSVECFVADVVLNGAVRAIYVDENFPSGLYGGDFTTESGQPRVRVMLGDDETNEALGAGFNGTVRAITAIGLSPFAGGEFTQTGATPLVGLGQFGGAWSPILSGAFGSVDGSVHALLLYKNELIVAGVFGFAGGLPSPHIARLNPFGGTPWFSSAPQDTTVDAFDDVQFAATLADGYAEGTTYTYTWLLNGEPLASGLRDSGALVTVNGAAITIANVTADEAGAYSLSVKRGCAASASEVYFTLTVNPPGPCTPDWIATFPADEALNGAPRALYAWDHDGLSGTLPKTIVGGAFNRVGTSPLARIAAWDVVEWVQLGDGLNGNVNALTKFDPDEDDGGESPWLVVGGAFTKSGADPVLRIARFRDGVNDFEQLGAGFNGAVNALVVFDHPVGGDDVVPQIIAAGAFTRSGQTPISRIARFDGAQWQPFGAGLNGQVHALVFMDTDGNGPLDAQVVAAGAFSKSGDTKVSRIARWDGTNWQPLDKGLNGTVYALDAADPDGDGPLPFGLIAAGSFTKAGNVKISKVALWDGTDWLPLGSGFNGTVYALREIDLDGEGPAESRLFAGGGFKKSGDFTVNRIAEFVNGTWAPLGGSASGTVRSLGRVFIPAGAPGTPALLVGGDFKTVDGLAQRAIAAFRCPLIQNIPAPTARAGALGAAAPVMPSVRPCSPADIAGGGATGGAPDGALTVDDLLAFTRAAIDDDARADLVGTNGDDSPDWLVTSDDLIAFVEAFVQGCD